MSYSLAIADGDLVASGSRLGVVYGIDKLRQDIYCAMMERHGSDRFHTSCGSVLQDFIGGIAKESTRVEVESEVLRVLQNYQAAQLKRFKENPELFSASELLVSVDDIKVTMTFDTIQVVLKLRNGSKGYTTIKVVTSTLF